MRKGNKQHGNREAKKPKANKTVVPMSATSRNPQLDARKAVAKLSSK
jgi:hypothetical protein